MITTIPSDLIILFNLGMIFGLGTFRNLDRRGSLVANKYFLAGILYNTVFCMPIAIYCYLVFPDWCWMYWLDASDAPTWLVLMAFAFYYVSFFCGFVFDFTEKNTFSFMTIKTKFLFFFDKKIIIH